MISPLTTLDVIFVGDWLKVIWVATAAVATFVVQDHPLRDRTDQRLVHHSMCVRAFVLHSNLPVTTAVRPTIDRPANVLVLVSGRHALRDTVNSLEDDFRIMRIQVQ